MAGVGAPPQGCGIIDAMSSQATPTADGGGRSSRPLKASSQPTHPAAPSGRQCSPAHDWTPSQFRPRTARDAYAHRDERANTPANLKQRKRNVREYTLGEEIANSISHGVGALLAIAAIPVLVVASLNAGGGIYLVTALVYTITMLLEYTMSTLYHAIAVDEAKRVFKVLDHSCIYLFIAGTYTPFCLITLAPFGGMWLCVAVWAIALAGVACAMGVRRALPCAGVVRRMVPARPGRRASALRPGTSGRGRAVLHHRMRVLRFEEDPLHAHVVPPVGSGGKRVPFPSRFVLRHVGRFPGARAGGRRRS